jgi:hypothetical protein
MATFSPAIAPEVLSPQGSAELRSFDREVRQTAKVLKSATMRLAFFASRLRAVMAESGGDWSVLGVQIVVEDENGDFVLRTARTEDEYRRGLDIPRSTYFKAVGIGEALSQLALEDMEQIPVGNAMLLLQVDPSIISAYPWVREAKYLSEEEFARKIALRNRQHGIDREPTANFSIKVPITTKKFLEETVERFRVEHELGTTAEALELLIADIHDRPNAMATMKAAKTLIEWSMGRIRRRKGGEERKEFLWLDRALKMLSKTYQAVRLEGPDEEGQEKVHPEALIYERPDRRQRSGEVPTEPVRSLRTTGEVGTDLADPTRPLHVMSDGTVLDGSEDDLEGDGGTEG